MLRMIRAARCQFQQEPPDNDTAVCPIGSGLAVALQTAGARWCLAENKMVGGQLDIGPPPDSERVMTRTQAEGASRLQKRQARGQSTLLGREVIGKEGMPRSRSFLDKALEVPRLPHAVSAPTGVLADVTNKLLGLTAGAGGGTSLPQPPPPQVAARRHCARLATAPAAALVSGGAAGSSSCSTSTFASTASTIDAEAEDCAASSSSSAVFEDADPVAEYVPDVSALLQATEASSLPRPDYLDLQPNVTPAMRAVVVDWMTEVHRKMRMRQQTLFVSVGVLDRFLAKRVIAAEHLQLAALAALLIACKFEEITPPQIQELLAQTGATSFQKEEVIRMEASMLTTLAFKVCWPTAVNFLELFQRLNGCSASHRDLTRYLLELTLAEYKMLKYPPSQLAAASVWLSNRLLRRRPSWPSELQSQSGMDEHAFKKCARDLCAVLEEADKGELQAVRRKYSHARYHEVAKAEYAAPQGWHLAPLDEARQRRTLRQAGGATKPAPARGGGGGAEQSLQQARPQSSASCLDLRAADSAVRHERCAL